MTTPSHGNGLLRRGGTNPGGGRPRNEFRARMRELAAIASQKEFAEQIIRDPNHPHWPFAVKWATERGFGPLPKPVEIRGAGGGPLVIRVVREG